MASRGRITSAAILVGIAISLVAVFKPRRLQVETVIVQRRSLQETSEEDGKTRIHDRYVLAATVPGKLRRLDLHAGDPVRANQVLAWIDPAPIEPRETAILQSRVRSAKAAQDQADAAVRRIEAIHLQNQVDLTRAGQLQTNGIISREAYEKTATASRSIEQELQAARAASESAAGHVQEAESALLTYDARRGDLPTEMRAPASGRVLRVFEQSERIVAAGAPILEIGYTPRLEIVADFLTREAVRLLPGMPVIITDWGGQAPLRARVRTVEPGAFTKVSPLGVEEQRTNVICDFEDSPDGLQDGYQVNVTVITWQNDRALTVPSSSVFRSGTEWAVFVVNNGRAKERRVTIGHKGEDEWEVLSGLSAGDSVINHPAPELREGVRVKMAG